MRPRRELVDANVESTYHCISRTVRRAFLLEEGDAAERGLLRRKAWICSRLKELVSIFAIDLDTFHVMDNHIHLLLTIRPQVAAAWSPQEVAERWLRLYRPCHGAGRRHDATEEEIAALAADADRIEELRTRLCSLSDFHRAIKEPLARLANREDGVTGHFWEGRFKCRRVLDEAAMLAVMAYIDLNAVRAGIVETPEDSQFAGIAHRVAELRACRRDIRGQTRGSRGRQSKRKRRQKRERRGAGTACAVTLASSTAADAEPMFLTPIGRSEAGQRRVLASMTVAKYLMFVDRMGRTVKPGKRGNIPSELPPILERLQLDADEFVDQMASSREWVGSVVGTLASCLGEACRCRRRWVVSTLRL